MMNGMRLLVPALMLAGACIATRAEVDNRAQLRSLSVRLRTDMTEIQVIEEMGVPKETEVGTCTVDRPDGRNGPWMCKIYTYGTVGFGTDGWMWLYFQRGPHGAWRLLLWLIQ
jgi:hypothetical protein